jgi:hypothetical protein
MKPKRNRKHIATLLCSAAAALAALAPGAFGLDLGQPIPAATTKMKNVDGKEIAIADVKGDKGTLVLFACNACPFVKAWEPRTAELGNQYRSRGIGVIQINSNDPKVQPADGYEPMQQRARDRKFEFPYVVDADSSVARAFGATRTSEVYLFDAAGKLVYHGAIDDNSQDASAVQQRFLRDALDAVLAGKEVPVKETKAIGCTIKFHSKS